MKWFWIKNKWDICALCGQKGRLLKNMHTGKCLCEDCISACVDQIKGSV